MMIDRKALAGFELWRDKSLDLVEANLDKLLAALRIGQPADIDRHIEAMRYAVMGGGKRLRPLLALASAEAVGGRAREALPAGLAVEFIHAYSLIHDDLPALDNDDLRRGQPTCHKVFGEAMAILAGDALLTLAFETIAKAASRNSVTLQRGGPAILALAKAAGPLGMVGGQVMDLAFEKNNPAADMVRDMERRKTGELIAAALVAGASLAGGVSADLTRLRKIGLLIGLAFQIKDDLLNKNGDPTILGKAVGSDADKGKACLPAILGEDEAEVEMQKLVEQAIFMTKPFGMKGANLRFMILSLTNREK